MANVQLADALRQEYRDRFSTCAVRANHTSEIETILNRIALSLDRYSDAGAPLGIPWAFIACVHQMESSGRFTGHLHNGDPLNARTVQVPAGRPLDGEPPFSWEDSARDALRLKRLDRWTDWSLPGILFRMEGYNGFGYRLHHPETPSPYLWSYSNQYTSGKYVADGKWDPAAVSRQAGAAVILKGMVERGMAEVEG